MDDLPPLPRWSIGKDDLQAEQLFRRLLERWLGSTFTAQTVAMLVDDICDFFGFKTEGQQLALANTLSREYGQAVTRDLLVRLAYQLVANRKELEAGRAVMPLKGVPAPEWVPFLIRRLVPCSMGPRSGTELHLLVIAGRYAGSSAVKRCPTAFLGRLAYDLGFNRRLVYDRPSELDGLLFAGLLVPTTENELQFEHYQLNTAMKRHNLSLIRTRKEQE